MKIWHAAIAAVVVATASGCGSVSSNADATTGSNADAARTPDAPKSVADAPRSAADAATLDAAPGDAAQVCTPNMALRCEGDNLISCNSAGTGEVSKACQLGCDGAKLQCNDVDPSNGLAQYLDVTAGEPAYNFAGAAKIDTDTGAVTVAGKAVTIKSFVVQTASPKIRVLAVGSLTTMGVTVTGANALAIVSNGDIKIEGTFSVSAPAAADGPGALTSSACAGGTSGVGAGALSGTGGGGFGSRGGRGGDANSTASEAGGGGGGTVGAPNLVPLRGGCGGGGVNGAAPQTNAGGAVQLVSRTRIVIDAILAANGRGGGGTVGGGSGGGILIEAPAVEVPGNVVANGGGGGCGAFTGAMPGASGGTDNTPAPGAKCSSADIGDGGNGAAGSTAAQGGGSVTVTDGSSVVGGGGGGGVGRIRINVLTGGFTQAGIISPKASVGDIGVR